MSSKITPALLIENVTKQYDSQHGIRDINLEVTKGEVFGFLGPNGAGKSTTINTILDLLKPDSGRITVLGLDHHKNVREVHKRIGFVSGDMETDPSLTGKQYLRYVAQLRGGIHHDRIDTLTTRFRADITTKIKHLSRGNKQKIGLIAALMHDPEMLIFDEPTSGLDPLMQAEFNEVIREQRAKGHTTFISSHVLSEVQSICDRVGFIRGGELIKVSSLESLMDHSSQRVSVHFKKSASLEKLLALNGVSKPEHKEASVSFNFNGNINDLLRFLAAMPISTLRITEPDLEELFMSYYQTEASDV